MSPDSEGGTSLVLQRGPRDDDELWEYVRTIWGVAVPRERVCDGHRAPFEAFADAYFARAPIIVWKASRGLAGKSFALAYLALTEEVTLAAEVAVLGGSGAQSQQVHKYMQSGWSHRRAPRYLLKTDPAKRHHELTNGGEAYALTASQKSARSPHPHRLRMDEADEMALDIFDAALGQTLESEALHGPVKAQTVISSTHQYSDGTMTEVLKRAAHEGWPVYEWCYRETVQPHGWLIPSEVARKRHEVTQVMWDTEYELQEPNPQSRAFARERIEIVFDTSLGEPAGDPSEELIFEQPQPGALYAVGADWAKHSDWTVIGVLRVDVKPARLVYFLRLGRLPWPVMVESFDSTIDRYPGAAAHDATGVGDVVADLTRHEVEDVVLVGRVRSEILSAWVKAIESLEVTFPRIQHMYHEHRNAQWKDLYGSGHPPDSVIMGAMCWRALQRADTGVIAAPDGSLTQSNPWSM